MFLKLSSVEAGSARHEVIYERQEGSLSTIFLGIRGRDLVEVLGLRTPDYLKIDVDGHELQVVAGCNGDVLNNLRGAIIELDHNEPGTQGAVIDLMSDHGLEVTDKRLRNAKHNTYNYLFVRK